MAPLLIPVSIMAASTLGCHLMMMMVVMMMLVLMMMVMLMVILMASMAVTMSGIKLRQELGRRRRNRESLACHQDCQCQRQSSGGIGLSLPLLRLS